MKNFDFFMKNIDFFIKNIDFSRGLKKFLYHSNFHFVKNFFRFYFLGKEPFGIIDNCEEMCDYFHSFIQKYKKLKL